MAKFPWYMTHVEQTPRDGGFLVKYKIHPIWRLWLMLKSLYRELSATIRLGDTVTDALAPNPTGTIIKVDTIVQSVSGKWNVSGMNQHGWLEIIPAEYAKKVEP
jgi:hypothetical protein